MGGIVKGIGAATGSTAPSTTTGVNTITGVLNKPGSLEAQVASLTKIVHQLLRELAEVEKHIKTSPDGITLHAGMSQIAILSSGVSIKSSKVRIKSASSDETLT